MASESSIDTYVRYLVLELRSVLRTDQQPPIYPPRRKGLIVLVEMLEGLRSCEILE